MGDVHGTGAFVWVVGLGHADERVVGELAHADERVVGELAHDGEVEVVVGEWWLYLLVFVV